MEKRGKTKKGGKGKGWKKKRMGGETGGKSRFSVPLSGALSHLSEKQRHPHLARSSWTDSAAVSDERFLLPDRRSWHIKFWSRALSVQPEFGRSYSWLPASLNASLLDSYTDRVHGCCRCASSVKVKESPRKARRFYRGFAMDTGWTSSPSSSSSFRSLDLFRFKGSTGRGEVGRVDGGVASTSTSTNTETRTGTSTSTSTGTSTGILVKSQWAQVRRKRGRGRGRGRAEARAGARAQARVRAGSRIEARSTRPRRGPATTWRCTSLRSHRTARRCRPVYNARRALTFHWH